MKGWMPRGFALLVLVAALCPASSTPEDELKSAAVLSFLRYSQWPQTSAGAITVGVFGRAVFAQTLTHTLEGKSINTRSVHVVPLDLNSDLSSCQVVYVAPGKSTEIRQILAATAAAHALTIGENDRFLDYGGVINLFLIDGHIGFEVSLENLERTGVTISSSMLRLGQIRDARKARFAQ